MSKGNQKKQNALKHGAYSREIMLPGEKLSDYKALRQALDDEWAPEGVTEQFLVDELFALLWKKRRMEQYNQLQLRQRVARIDLENEIKRGTNIIRAFAADFCAAATAEAVEEVFSRLDPAYAEATRGTVPLDKCKDPTKWGQEIGKFFSNLKMGDPLEGPNLFAEILNPDAMEMEISRSDRLGEIIDRKIKRLMQVKTAKQIFSAMRKNAKPESKLINPPDRADDQSSAIIEYKPAPTADAQIIISEGSYANNDAFAPQNVVAIEETHVVEDGPVSISPDVTEKVHSYEGHAKVEVFANPPPGVTLEYWQSFCAHRRRCVNVKAIREESGLVNCI